MTVNILFNYEIFEIINLNMYIYIASAVRHNFLSPFYFTLEKSFVKNTSSSMWQYLGLLVCRVYRTEPSANLLISFYMCI